MDKRQEWFNKVWDHFVVQRNPASYDTEAELCLYNGPNGARCAFAVLLTDTELQDTKSLEGESAETVIKELQLSEFFGHESFMAQLQSAHDGAVIAMLFRFRENIAYNLRNLAEDEGLEVPE